MPKVAIGGFGHESNTFSPLPTPYEVFSTPSGMWPGLLRGNLIIERLGKSRTFFPTSGFIPVAERLGFEIAPLVFTVAEPSNAVSASAFERIVAHLCSALSDAMPVDAVYLDLHGAMVYEPYQDGETEILRRVRAIVGPDVPVIVSYDLHGNINCETFEMADAMVGYRTYPHIDGYETGERAAYLVNELLSGKPLYKAYRSLPFLISLSRQSTHTEPARSAYAILGELERDPEIVSTTLMMGFPPADLPHTGVTMFSYARSQAAADRAADRIYQFLMDHEADFQSDAMEVVPAVEKAIELAKTAHGPVILADMQDNPGGGATADTVWLLEALRKQDAPESALGLLFDPEAAAAAYAAGEGAEIKIGLGGKLVPGQNPFEGVFCVEKLHEGPFMLTGPMGGGMLSDLGKMAHLRIGSVHVAIASQRTQCLDQAYLRVVGIEPDKMKILVLKSAHHYRADFEPISSAIINVAAPASIVEDTTQVVYKHLRKGVRLCPLGPEQK